MKIVTSEDIASFLDSNLYGENIMIDTIGTLSSFSKGSLVFAKEYNDQLAIKLNEIKQVMLISTDKYMNKLNCAYVIVDNPRLSFLRVVKEFFYSEPVNSIHETAIISASVKIGTNVNIGPYSVIEGDVTIGDNTYIANGVYITGNVSIGNNCWIKSGAVIGEEGFGFELNKQGYLEHFPHIGRIEIGNNVFIGANSTIERATIDITRVDDYAAVDDLTQIGHNVYIGKSTTVCCGAVLCGGVRVGNNCNIAPNSCVKQKVEIADNCIIGLGAVVLKDVPYGKVYVGNPAKELIK